MDHFIHAFAAFAAIIGVFTFIIGPLILAASIERNNARLANTIGFSWLFVLLFVLCYFITK